MLTVVVDGYNVIHAVPEFARQLDRSLEAAREALLAACRIYRARRGDIARLCVIFDGDERVSLDSPIARGGVAAIFTHRQEEADARILELIRASGHRHRFLVVSNDILIINNARAHGADVLSAQAFAAQLRPKPSSRAGGASSVDERAISPRQAQEITEAYRRHLETASKTPKARRRRPGSGEAGGSERPPHA